MHHIGVLVGWEKDFRAKFEQLRELELDCCQVCCWYPDDYTDARAKEIREAAEATGVTVTALWAGWSGPKEWNLLHGPQTLGLVPPEYRAMRLKELKDGADFAAKIGVSDIITHVGFLPEVPCDPNFMATVEALRDLCRYLGARGQNFLFETGQETPMTLLRAIERIEYKNVGINFDTANLICYGKANSVDALELLGPYVRNLHIKDTNPPTDGMTLGKEVPLGQGRANIPACMKALDACGYQGPWIIEREISGEQQIKDICMARDMLREIEKTL
jgi:sugar phosphate isomerase/epimerase